MQTLLHSLRRSRWANLLVVNLRLALGFAFLPAGLKKVLGQRFTDAANTGAFHEFLHAFYATGAFYRFVGGVQLLVALLLMTQTYGTLGALLALPLFTAITMLCWSTGAVPTAVMTTLMLLGAAALCAWDYEAFRGVLRPASDRLQGAVQRADVSAAVTPAPIDLALWRACGATVLTIYLAACALAGGVYRPRGVELANPQFYVLPLLMGVPVVTWLRERQRRAQDGTALK